MVKPFQKGPDKFKTVNTFLEQACQMKGPGKAVKTDKCNNAAATEQLCVCKINISSECNWVFKI